ncbi:hypothetical protein ACFL0Y_00210 [Patescibacteria group bacterium]
MKEIAKNIYPIGTVVEEDPGENQFRPLVTQWVNGTISYQTLVRNTPASRLSLPQKALRTIFDLTL